MAEREDMFIQVDFRTTDELTRSIAIYELLLSITNTLTSHGEMMAEIKRESGETVSKVNELLVEVGGAVNRLLAINASQAAIIEQLRAGEIDATQAAAEQDALQTRLDTEIEGLKGIGVPIEEPLPEEPTT